VQQDSIDKNTSSQSVIRMKNAENVMKLKTVKQQSAATGFVKDELPEVDVVLDMSH